MDWSSREPREIVEQWAQSSVPNGDETSNALRDRVVAELIHGMDRARARRRPVARHQLFFRLSLAAAAVFAVFAVSRAFVRLRAPAVEIRHSQAVSVATWSSVQGRVGVERRGKSTVEWVRQTAGDPTFLGPGDEVVTFAGGRTSLELSSGVRLAIGETSRVGLPQAGDGISPGESQQIRLEAGSVRVQVPHLGLGRRFAVETQDTEVIVHGTMFSVEVVPATGAGGTTTNVVVTEGVVSVRSGGQELFLRAGSRWSSERSRPPEPAEIVTGKAALPTVREHPAAAPASVVPAGPSNLAEQNRMLQAAMSASRNRHFPEAIAQLRAFIQRYPTSTLEQEARVQLFRALEQGGDRAGAEREARRYLQSYPEGFAREEARRLALGR